MSRGRHRSRHREPTGPARSGRPDDKLREAIQGGAGENLDRFVAAAPGDDENAYFHLASPGEVARAAQAAKGNTGIGAKSRHSSRRPSGDSPWQDPGANASRQQRRPARPLLQCSCEQRSRIRPSNKCPASGICMTWGRRQTQNVHRPCLRVYTRTAISRMRRSARVQRGRAIFCSIAAGANYRSVACARSAH